LHCCYGAGSNTGNPWFYGGSLTASYGWVNIALAAVAVFYYWLGGLVARRQEVRPNKVELLTAGLLLWIAFSTTINPDVRDGGDALAGIVLFFGPMLFFFVVYHNPRIAIADLERFRTAFLYLGYVTLCWRCGYLLRGKP